MSDGELQARIDFALDFAAEYALIDGDHHKMWVIDQMVRALFGVPLEEKTGTDVRGQEYTYHLQGENDEYAAWADHEWDEGIAP